MLDDRFHEVISPTLYPMLDEIIVNMKTDFTSNVDGYFEDAELGKIFKHARDLLLKEAKNGKIYSGDDLAKAWNKVVADFHHNDHWGHPLLKGEPPKPPKRASAFPDYLKTALMSALFLKPGVYYFGIQYSKYPGEGYGWGLFLTIALSIINVGILIWRNRHASE